jgi:hypothetical protein
MPHLMSERLRPSEQREKCKARQRGDGVAVLALSWAFPPLTSGRSLWAALFMSGLPACSGRLPFPASTIFHQPVKGGDMMRRYGCPRMDPSSDI